MTISEAIQKLEHYCAYQDRCHAEVVQKLYSYKMESSEMDQIIVHLINEKFLDETRFACSFARGKHRIKNWGKVRITNELKARQISQTIISIALKEISSSEYEETFDNLANRCWENLHEKNTLKKKKKFCDYLLRRGFESNLIYAKLKQLESV